MGWDVNIKGWEVKNMRCEVDNIGKTSKMGRKVENMAWEVNSMGLYEWEVSKKG